MQHSFWRGRSVLVTGATGLVGGALVNRLVAAGAEVAALTRPSATRGMPRWNVPERVAVVQGSVEDGRVLQAAMCARSVRTVFHVAAQPLVGVAKCDPVDTLKTNVSGTWNVLEACRQSHVSEVLATSSNRAYAGAGELAHKETDRLEGRSPYDVSKSCADLLCGMYAATYSLPVAMLRFANVFGGGDLNFSRLVPGVIRSALMNEPFRIASAGRTSCAPLYVEDAVDAYLSAAEAIADCAVRPGEAFNLSTGSKTTVAEVVDYVLKVMGRTDLRPIVQNEASSENGDAYMCCDKARTVLGWQPRYSFDAGLRETIPWYEAYFGVERGAADRYQQNATVREQAVYAGQSVRDKRPLFTGGV